MGHFELFNSRPASATSWVEAPCRLLVALIVIIGSACDRQAGLGLEQTSVLTDSAGIELVFSVEPHSAAEWHTGPEPTWQVSTMDGMEPLHRVVDAARMPDGRIVALNGDPVQVLLFDQKEVLVRQFSGRGQGPGEFLKPIALEVDQQSRIRVSDGELGPTYIFDTLGTIVHEQHWDLERLFAALGPGRGSESRIPIAGGRALIPVDLRGGPALTTKWQADWGLRSWVVVDSNYDTFETGDYRSGILAVKSSTTGGGMMVAPLLFHLSHTATTSDPFRLWISDAAEYRIDVRDSNGQLLRVIRKQHVPQRLDDTLVVRLEAEVGAQYRGLSPSEYKAAQAALPDRQVFPVILGLVVDSEGMLWVRETLREWSVFDRAGRWVTTVNLSLHKVYDIGVDYVIGLALDPDGAESIVELALHRNTPR